jgi:hypothetical protein
MTLQPVGRVQPDVLWGESKPDLEQGTLKRFRGHWRRWGVPMSTQQMWERVYFGITVGADGWHVSDQSGESPEFSE